MDLSRIVLASFAQAQLEAAVDSFERRPTRTSLDDLKRAVAAYERCQSIARQRGPCRLPSSTRVIAH